MNETNKTRCFVTDDEKHAAETTCKYIERTPYLELAGVAFNGEDTLDFLTRNKVDILFLDIHMPGLSGLDILKITDTPVILTTAFREYAIDGFEHGVIDYLLKPFSYQRFLKAVQKAIQLSVARTTVATTTQQSTATAKDYLFVNGEHKGKKIKIDFKDIIYIESEKRYVIFHCAARKHISVMSLRDVESMLAAHDFVRIHNAIIVSMRRVVAVDGNEVMLGNTNDNKSYRLPIGITYKARVMELMNT